VTIGLGGLLLAALGCLGLLGGCSPEEKTDRGPSDESPPPRAETPKEAMLGILAHDTRDQREMQGLYIHMGPKDEELHEAMYEFGRAARDFYTLYVAKYGTEGLVAPLLWMVTPEQIEQDFRCEINDDEATGWLKDRKDVPFGLVKFIKLDGSWLLDLSGEVPKGSARKGFLRSYKGPIEAFNDLSQRIRKGAPDGKVLLEELRKRGGIPAPPPPSPATGEPEQRENEASSPARTRTDSQIDPAKVVAEGGKFWSCASNAKQGEKKIAPGKLIWIWPDEDRVYAAKPVRKLARLLDKRKKAEAKIPLRLHWAFRGPAAKAEADQAKWTWLCWWYTSGGSGRWHFQSVNLPEDETRGTLDAEIALEASSGKSPIIVFMRMGQEFLKSPVASNLLLVQAEVAKNE